MMKKCAGFMVLLMFLVCFPAALAQESFDIDETARSVLMLSL